jgi:hypothetical protein
MAGLPLLIIVKASKGSAICRLPIRFGVRGFPRPILDGQSKTMHDIPSSPTAQCLLLSHSLLLSTSVMGKAKCLTNLNFFHIPPTFQSPARRPSCGVPGLRFAIPGSKSSPRKIDPKRMSSAQVWRHSGQRA